MVMKLVGNSNSKVAIREDELKRFLILQLQYFLVIFEQKTNEDASEEPLHPQEGHRRSWIQA